MDYEKYIDYIGEIPDTIKVGEVTILTGRNAGGKSLIRKLLRESISKQLGKEKVLILQASQELRTKTNPEMGALGSMAHDLEWLATSKNTLHGIEMIFSDRYKPDYIVIDEPEIGMGEELQLGLAEWLNEKIAGTTCGVLVITHSKNIVNRLKHDKFINLEGMNSVEWLNRKPQKISIEEFTRFSDELFEAIRDRINENKKSK